MFNFFRTQTDLQNFCDSQTYSIVAEELSFDMDSSEKATAIAKLWLHVAGNLVGEIRSDKRIRQYVRRLKADVAIFETLRYIECATSYQLMEEAIDEDEALDITETALSRASGYIEMNSSFEVSYELIRSRTYVPDLQKATDRYALLLEHSCFNTTPVLKPAIDLSQADVATHIGLKAHTTAFSKTVLPALIETGRKIIESEFSD